MMPPKIPIHVGHRERLRARVREDGLDGFADHQVLELLLFQTMPRGDTNPLAHRLLERFGSLAAVLEADPADLATVEGIGEQGAAFLSLIPAVTRRYFRDRVTRERLALTTSEAVAAYAIPLMVGRAEEVFYVLCLDAHCRVLYPALVNTGTVTEAPITPRQVVETALRHRAVSVVFVHNHPAGGPTPSTADHQLTRRLMQAFVPLGIKVLDHVIVAGDQTYSFSREGVLLQPEIPG